MLLEKNSQWRTEETSNHLPVESLIMVKTYFTCDSVGLKQKAYKINFFFTEQKMGTMLTFFRQKFDFFGLSKIYFEVFFCEKLSTKILNSLVLNAW